MNLSYYSSQVQVFMGATLYFYFVISCHITFKILIIYTSTLEKHHASTACITS